MLSFFYFYIFSANLERLEHRIWWLVLWGRHTLFACRNTLLGDLSYICQAKRVAELIQQCLANIFMLRLY